jgi:hypothetical protein
MPTFHINSWQEYDFDRTHRAANWQVSARSIASDGTPSAAEAVFVGGLLCTGMAMLAHCCSRVGATFLA